jgi:hypothetical protein
MLMVTLQEDHTRLVWLVLGLLLALLKLFERL